MVIKSNFKKKFAIESLILACAMFLSNTLTACCPLGGSRAIFIFLWKVFNFGIEEEMLLKLVVSEMRWGEMRLFFLCTFFIPADSMQLCSNWHPLVINHWICSGVHYMLQDFFWSIYQDTWKQHGLKEYKRVLVVHCARPALKRHPCLNIISGSHLSPQPEWREERRAIDSRHTSTRASPPCFLSVKSISKLTKHIHEIKYV